MMMALRTQYIHRETRIFFKRIEMMNKSIIFYKILFYFLLNIFLYEMLNHFRSDTDTDVATSVGWLVRWLVVIVLQDVFCI